MYIYIVFSLFPAQGGAAIRKRGAANISRITGTFSTEALQKTTM